MVDRAGTVSDGGAVNAAISRTDNVPVG
jgi:hypothetical protein